MSDETCDMLRKAGEDYSDAEVRRLCVSVASYIAEIDSSSSDVAAYLEQRLGHLLWFARQHGGIEAFERAKLDGRKLMRAARNEPM